MILNLKHKSLDICAVSRSFVTNCYRVSRLFPPEERFEMGRQLRRAARSVHLDIAQGCARKSETDRKRMFDSARSSLVEIDALLDIAAFIKYLQAEELREPGSEMIRLFQMLHKMIGKKDT